MSEIKPKSCPFCGCEKIEAQEIDPDGNVDGYSMCCRDCLMQGPATITAPAALTLWDMLPRKTDEK